MHRLVPIAPLQRRTQQVCMNLLDVHRVVVSMREHTVQRLHFQAFVPGREGNKHSQWTKRSNENTPQGCLKTRAEGQVQSTGTTVVVQEGGEPARAER